MTYMRRQLFCTSIFLRERQMKMERWVGKVAIVTGASSGIGEAISRALVDARLNVLGLARREDKLREIAESLKSTTKGAGSFDYVRCDLRNETDILDAFAYVEKKFNGVDILVNNAGIFRNGFLTDATTDTYRTILDVNVLAVAICTREAIRLMRKNKNEGHIFNINSVLGRNATLASFPVNIYPASKFALRAMTETVISEITANKDQIRVTGIHSGLVKTQMMDTAVVSKDSEGEFVTPYLKCNDITDCVIFALSLPPMVQLDEITVAPLHQKF